MATKLYVGPLSAGVSVRDLTGLLAQYGTVTNAQIPTHPKLGSLMGFGFVEMINGADLAITALNGSKFMGTTLAVHEARGHERTSDDRFSDINDRYEVHYSKPGSMEFRAVIHDLTDIAETGHLDAARMLADILVLRGPNYDPESAYKWYYIALSQQGYTVQFKNENHSSPHYLGQTGDFRNESMVSDLVRALGFDKVRSLDDEAANWLAVRGLTKA